MNDFLTFIKERALYFLKGKFLSKNTTAKIVSIIFALVLWLYVMGEVNPESVISLTDVKVKLLNEDTLKQSGLVIVGDKDFSVNVKIRGRRNDLYRIRSEDILATADLRGYQKGEINVPVNINAPPYVSVEEVSPKYIRITLDQIVARKKPVVVQTSGKAAEGFEPGEATVFPDEVIVEGAEVLVNKVMKVVANVSVKGQIGQIAERVPLQPVDKDGKKVSGVSLRTKWAEIVLPMHRVKEVPISVSLKGTPKENFKVVRVEANPERILLKGSEEQLAGIKEVKTTDIQLDGLDKSITKTVQLLLPEGVKTSYANRGIKVNVVIEAIKSKEFTFFKDEIDVRGLESAYTAELKELPDTIRVQVFAAESIANNLDKKDIQLYIYASGLPMGTHSENISYSITKEVERVNIFPERATVEIYSP